MGRHTLKFGAEYRYYQMNNRNGGGFVGQFGFSGGETGYDVADYLLGAPVFVFAVEPAGARWPQQIRRDFRAGFLPAQIQPDRKLRFTVGIQHTVV